MDAVSNWCFHKDKRINEIYTNYAVNLLKIGMDKFFGRCFSVSFCYC